MAHILIVDEQPCVRQLLAAELILEWHYTASAGDRESAMTYVSRFRPDLVILDLSVGGVELLENMKRRCPLVPVIIFTADSSFKADPRLSQAEGYEIKSIDLEGLKKKIVHVLGTKPVSRTRPGQPSPVFNVV